MSALAHAEVAVESNVLGALLVTPNQVFDLDQRLFGFPDAGTFALIPSRRDGLFWLQSIKFEALTFLLIDPFRFVEGYAVDIGPDELGDLAPDDLSEILVLSILTLPRHPDETATANLKGPIVLNLVKRRGRQVAIESPYGLRHAVNLSPN